MLGTLIEKELKTIILSPKFAAVFAVCSILIILSVYLGIDEYRTAIRHYETVNAQLDQQTGELTRWSSVRLNIVRRPDPMHIFVTGVNNDIGRQSPILRGDIIKLYGSRYSDQLLFALFRSVDLMFIVQIVLSLFAILFTYDSICGERESGTLKLNFANPIPRTTYILAKIAGTWLGLIIPLLIPFLLGIIMVLIYRIPLTGSHWAKFFVLIFTSGLYLSFFVCMGVMFSALSRNSSGSFLYLLVIWVVLVLIIPRAGVMIAGRVLQVPTPAEISTKLTEKRRETSKQLSEWLTEYSKEMQSRMASLSNEDRENEVEEIQEQYSKDVSKKYSENMQEIDKYYISLNEDWRNRKTALERMGFSISRFSPASAYQLASMQLAGTDLDLKNRYEDQLQAYKAGFYSFIAKKEDESGGIFNTVSQDKKPEKIDTSEIPKFAFVMTDPGRVLKSTVIDIGIISFYILITIAGSFIAFLRYDVR